MSENSKSTSSAVAKESTAKKSIERHQPEPQEITTATGVYQNNGASWMARITKNGKSFHLGNSTDRNWCIARRREAEEHLKAGDFEQWYQTIKNPPTQNEFGIRGVSQNFKKGKDNYRAIIKTGGTVFYLGIHDTIEAAAAMRLAAEEHIKAGDFEQWHASKPWKQTRIPKENSNKPQKTTNKIIDGINYKLCLVCGVYFPCPTSASNVCCSVFCSRVRKVEQHLEKPHPWSEEARDRARANAAENGRPENLEKGTPAVMQSPITGRFETNQNAKIWTLIDPNGVEYVVRNLLMWAREHTYLFGFEPGDHSANKIRAGFGAVAQTLASKRVNTRPAMSYKGWTLKELPRDP